MRVLCVAEKNSIAKSVASILGGGQVKRRDTKSKYIKNYDFTFDFGGYIGTAQVTMTSVSGHLTEASFPSEYNSWSSVPQDILFDARIVTSVSKNANVLADNIKKEARNATYLYIWTDCDREGEHIGMEITNVAKISNPRIHVIRADFNNLEKRHIIQASKRPRELSKDAADAVSARIELDFRLGAIFTRLQTLQLQRAFEVLQNKVISYGPCQFPTLGFVVDRWQRVEDFVPENFWSLKLVDKRERQTVNFSWKRNRVYDRLAAILFLENCLDAKIAKVVKVNKKPAKRYKPIPLSTVELTKMGPKYLRLSSKKTLELAESLYTNGFVSYPRTETDQFDAGMDLQGIIGKLAPSEDWGTYAQGLLDGNYRTPRKGKHNDRAHPPIHPINLVHRSALSSQDHWKVYELITRRFLACCSENAIGAETIVDLQMGDEFFSQKGLVILERNYLDVYPYDKWTGTGQLPVYQVNEEFIPNVLNITDSVTTSPSYLTEPELISLMDANGIGTDATMADHIEKVQEREYVIKRKKRGAATEFVPSSLGIALAKGYDEIGLEWSLTKPFLRKEMEDQLKNIEKGQLDRDALVQMTLTQFRDVFHLTKQRFDCLKNSCRLYLIELNEG
ncbi:DNA topoisomerase III [Schizosaccharomyces cryophilus OY26]|uniref:DNA topoisomerase n=1 Tax=Schizosaccharomyces cryophilus (strain OY26 / ATCC MYA-4695 / CBS 11777 / NBRC 106824 / NRRL Y48691) TaxID=653667 RepID=S9VQR0_SCHCR|nr:DNA topoisomerase III [Schizosaccharomyces cryophilus OY26]EPY50273.1 DNA topoisomerase III [Schizosaccharomyces cryophilus OY26]